MKKTKRYCETCGKELTEQQIKDALWNTGKPARFCSRLCFKVYQRWIWSQKKITEALAQVKEEYLKRAEK